MIAAANRAGSVPADRRASASQSASAHDGPGPYEGLGVAEVPLGDRCG